MAIDLRGLTPLLQVYDMPTSLTFYRDLLGFSVVSSSPVLGEDKVHWVLLRQGDAELMLNTAYEFDDERPAETEPGRTTGHNDVGLFIGCPDVDAAYQYLLGKGVKVSPPRVAPYGMKQMYLKDPDGFGICFQWSAETDSTR